MENIPKSQRGKKHRAIGIDLGNKTLACLSTGLKIPEHPSLPRLRYNLRCAKRKLARQTPHSKRWKETQRIITKTEQEIRQARQDHANKLAHTLTKSYRIICIEGKVPNSRETNENWDVIRDTLRKKCKERNRAFVEVAPFYTSQTCIRCGHIQKMPKEERTYHCPACGLSLDRDILAAVNIRRNGLSKLTKSR